MSQLRLKAELGAHNEGIPNRRFIWSALPTMAELLEPVPQDDHDMEPGAWERAAVLLAAREQRNDIIEARRSDAQTRGSRGLEDAQDRQERESHLQNTLAHCYILLGRPGFHGSRR